MVVRLGALATSAERQQSLLSLPGLNPGSVVVDLTGLSSVDGATLGAILLLRQALREQGGGVRLRGCSDAVSSVLQSLRLERLVSPQG
jgi:anti-anti-sigma factor